MTTIADGSSDGKKSGSMPRRRRKASTTETGTATGAATGSADAAPPRLRGEVQIRPLCSVRPNGWNENEMEPEVAAALAAGFRKEGWLVAQALLIWGTDETGARRDLIIDGEQRWTTGIRLAMPDGPMVFLDGITEAEARALTVKLYLRRGAWDRGDLATYLAGLVPRLQLSRPEVAIELGYTQRKLDELIALGSKARDELRLPDGRGIRGQQGNAVGVILAELQIPPAISKAFLPELRALVARFPGVALNLA